MLLLRPVRLSVLVMKTSRLSFLLTVLCTCAALRASAAPIISATQDDGTPAATRKAVGDTITYTTTISNTAAVVVGSTANDATGVQLTNPTPANTTDSGSVTISPIAFDDVFPQSIMPNMKIDSSLVPYSVFSNDFAGTPATTTIASFDATSVHGGTVTMVTSGASIGQFTYNPPAGYTGADSFTYTLTNSVGSSVGTVNLTVAASPIVWFVNPAVASTGNGTLASPFKTVAEAVTAIGNNTGQRIFLYSGSQTTLIPLKANAWLIGQGATGGFDAINGISPESGTIARPSLGGTKPALTNAAGGSVITFSDANTIVGVAITGNASGVAVASTGTVNSGQIGNAVTNDVTITGVGGGSFSLGAGNLSFSVYATISSTVGRSVAVSGRTGGNVSFSGAITDTGTGISLTTNTGAQINFTGGLNLSTGANAAFNATGGGTVNVTQNNTTIVNTLATTTGTALTVQNTNIGGSGLTFRSISANGAANGLVLNTTGASGGLTVTGDAALAINSTGGTIQSTTGHGVSLTNTLNPVLTHLNIQNTQLSGIRGTQVNGFTLQYSTINNVNLSHTADDSNVAFNATGTPTIANLTGAVTITNNVLNNSYQFGVDITQYNGTISNLNISNNSLTSGSAAGTSFGSAVRLQILGTASTGAILTKASINNNIARNFPNSDFLVLNAGNSNAGAPSASAGTFGSGTNVIDIKNNDIQGFSSTTYMANGIAVAVNKNGQGNFNIDGNGTSVSPIKNIGGNGVSVAAFGSVNVSCVVNNNYMDLFNIANSAGINIGADQATAGVYTETPTLNVTVTNNNVKDCDGNPIIATVKQCSGTGNFKIQNNNLATPINGPNPPYNPGATYGIRVESGANTGGNSTVNLNISGNTASGGTTAGGTTVPGIGLRQEHAAGSGTNTLAINGLSPSPSNDAQMVSYVSSLNPNSVVGTNGSKVDSISSGATYVFCNLPLQFAPAQSPTRAKAYAAISASAAAPVAHASAHATTRDTTLPLSQGSAEVSTALTQAELDTAVVLAREHWAATGLSDQQVAALKQLRFVVTDELPAKYLGAAGPDKIRVSSHAAGNGWHTSDDISSTPGATRVDLLTAVMHEMGHALGLPDCYAPADRSSVMYGYLTTGERRLPIKDQARDAVPGSLIGGHFLGSPVSIGTLPPGKSVKIVYSVTVGPITTINPQQVSSQGTVSGGNFSNVLTSDLVAGSGATVTLLAIPPAITSGNATTFTVGSAGSFNVTSTGAPAASYSFTGTLPSGVTLSAAGLLSGTPGAGTGGTYPIVITANNGVAPNATQSFTLTVNQAPAITSANATTLVVGTAGSFTVTTTGFPTPTITQTGTLPSGVTFDGTMNKLVGTPGAGTGGTYPISFKAANGVGTDAVQSFTLTVNQAPAITSANATTFTVGTAGTFTVTATGFPSPTSSETGALPAGVTLGAISGVLGGTPGPDTQGTYNITMMASNGVGSAASQPFTLTVNAIPCTAAVSGLISWLPANNNANDLIGSNNAVMQGGATFGTGEVGGSLNLVNAPNATSGQYVNVATPVGLPVGNAARTIQLWFNTATTLTASPTAALIQYGTATSEKSFGLVFNATNPGKLYFNGSGDDLAGATTVTPNAWHHAAVTYDGATVKLYLDGQLDGSKATALLNTALDANGLTIGLRPGTAVFNGKIDEVQIFNRALTQAEIQATYYAGAQGNCAPPLTLSSAVSRRTHTGVGAFDVSLPLSGAAGIEPRGSSPQGQHTVVFTFSHNVMAGSASVTTGAGTAGAPTYSGNTMTVNLTGVTDAQQLTLTVTGTTDALGQTLASTGVNMAVLLGDVNGDGSVNSGDATVTRNRSGQPTSAANFRADVNVDGTINSGDATIVRANSGHGLTAAEPAPPSEISARQATPHETPQEQ